MATDKDVIIHERVILPKKEQRLQLCFIFVFVLRRPMVPVVPRALVRGQAVAIASIVPDCAVRNSSPLFVLEKERRLAFYV